MSAAHASHGATSTGGKKKKDKKAFKSTALGTYAEMLNWEQRIKNEEGCADEWAHTWGQIYKPNEDYDTQENELASEIARMSDKLRELNEMPSSVASAERIFSSQDHRRKATANDLGGAAQPV